MFLTFITQPEAVYLFHYPSLPFLPIPPLPIHPVRKKKGIAIISTIYDPRNMFKMARFLHPNKYNNEEKYLAIRSGRNSLYESRGLNGGGGTGD